MGTETERGLSKGRKGGTSWCVSETTGAVGGGERCVVRRRASGRTGLRSLDFALRRVRATEAGE